jgi:topoisomerase-4 subunit A
LKSELEIQLSELETMAFLVFGANIYENKIYRDWGKKQLEDVIQAVDDGLKHIKHLKRAITEEDILRLLDIRIMHI